MVGETIRRRALVVGGAGGFGLLAGARAVTAQDQDGGPAHPIVGSWLVTVNFAEPAGIALTNLVTYGADGNVLVANGGEVPGIPPGAGLIFTEGHGAWAATGERTADATFVFLTINATGDVDSTNTVRSSVEIDATGDAYTGSSTLTIVGTDGGTPIDYAATFEATRIVVEPMAAAATPTA